MESALVPPLLPRLAARLLAKALQASALGVVISLVVHFFFGRTLVGSFAYSVPITLGCWFFIDLGRMLAARWVAGPVAIEHRWPGWPWMALVIVIGTALGYSAGNAVGNLLTGGQVPGLFAARPAQALAVLVAALVPGLLATHHFYTRERLAAEQARSQRAQREAAQAQLRLLESQLEPHMLFNTLANLRVLITLDPPRAQAMLDRLIAFLRATLEASRVGRHTLSAEFARLADYLALMQVRMGDRLQSRLDLPDELASVAVPPLLLQPLVENAIRHGLEPRIAGGRIEIVAARDGTDLVLSVRDTGVGLGAGDGGGTRFGLQQVRERLATLHGDRASLQLVAANGPEGGALATVRLPFVA